MTPGIVMVLVAWPLVVLLTLWMLGATKWRRRD